MTAAELLADLAAMGYTLEVGSTPDRLRIAPEPPAELLAQVAEHKTEILAELRSPPWWQRIPGGWWLTGLRCARCYQLEAHKVTALLCSRCGYRHGTDRRPTPGMRLGGAG